MANFSDKLLDEITAHSIRLFRVTSSIKKKILNNLLTLEDELEEDIRKNAGTEFNQERLKKLLAQTKETIQKNFKIIAQTHAKSLQEVFYAEIKNTARMANSLLGVDVMSVAITETQAAKIASNVLIDGAKSKDWWSRQDKDLRIKFSDKMRQGLLRGQTTDELARVVRGRKATKNSPAVPGLLEVNKRQSEAIVRTSVQTVANDARLDTYKQNLDVVKGIQWVSTLDSRTTPICIALHGKQWSLPDYKPIGHDKPFPGPTAHWGCRSTQISILKSWDELRNESKA